MNTKKKKLLIIASILLVIAIVLSIIICSYNSNAGKLRRTVKELCISYNVEYVNAEIINTQLDGIKLKRCFVTVESLDEQKNEDIINFLLDVDDLGETFGFTSSLCRVGKDNYSLLIEESEYLVPSCTFIKLLKNYTEEQATAVLSDGTLNMNKYDKYYKKEMEAKNDSYDSFETPTIDDNTYNTDDLKDELTIDTDGKQIWKVYLFDGTFSFEGTYRGSGNFIVTLLDDNQDFVSLICNEIGDYNVDKTVYSTEGWHYLKIEWSYGSWNANWYGTYGN